MSAQAPSWLKLPAWPGLLLVPQVHGKLYKSLFGCDPEPGLIASGFAIRRGLQWRFNSGTFNHWQSTYTMDTNEQELVKVSGHQLT
jgi:hypothetical protein